MEGKLQCWVFLLIVASFSLIPATYANVKTQYCGSEEDYLVKVDSVDIDPNPVVRGETATFSINAISEDSISGGKLTIEVFFFGLRIHTEDHDLCTKTACPVKEGSFVITHAQSLPGFTPPGSYRLRVKLTDVDNKLLTCVYVQFSIVRNSIVSAIEDTATSGVL
ncbi:hypothetical protein SUGI_0627840 [Cryptomeria japonica]|uniref:uncharacterized protein LOC131039074 n=1 Tax=Cryptomeria japonica TaxID=3369 RepID=UPI0024147E5F|nr:uncharacterized protein LOC131039074 [Cryptomeria japonica]GLJ31299.1 hypothetical protein SUGI_0627840 [Cryptomeria japonica]